MISRTAVTHQMDDVTLAAEELARGIAVGTPLGANKVGLLLCYSDMDLEDFVAALRARVDFDIIGCTCIASVDEKEGFHEMAATLLVLSADDCSFCAAVSGAIDTGNVHAQVADTFARVERGLPGKAKLLLAIPPYNLGIMLDEYTQALNDIAKGIPVVGGLPSNNGGGDKNATVFGGEAHEDCLVMLGISGNVRPVFSVQNVTGSIVERKRKVTRAKDNTVYRVGDQTFTEYLQEVGLPLETLERADTITFVSNPVLLENVKLDGEEDYSFVRTLHALDLEEGSGTAIGMIPEDATLSVCSLEKDDIRKAAGIGMRDLKAKMQAVQAEGYAFSAVIAVSCIGRYLLMVPQSDTEYLGMRAELPEGVAFAGFYGYGEIGPLPRDKAEILNFAHNESLVLCAL